MPKASFDAELIALSNIPIGDILFILTLFTIDQFKGGEGGVHNFTTRQPRRPSAFAGWS